MSGCRYRYRDGEGPCDNPVHEDGDLCLWHNPQVDKHPPYVARLLAQQLEHRPGDARAFHLRGLCWPQARLDGCDLRDADLADAVLVGGRLRGADLRGASLKRANLQGADLRDADLSGADLTRTHLRGACLARAKLCGCLVDGTVLLGADLRRADLGEARIVGFTWNRLSRFAGLRWGDAAGGEGPEGTPPEFGEHRDLSSSVRRAVDGRDPALEDTRYFDRSADRSPATRPLAAEDATVAMSNDEEAAIVRRSRFPERRAPVPFRLTAIVLLFLWAVGATALAVSGWSRRRPASDSPQSEPVARTEPAAGEEDAGLRARIAELQRDLELQSQERRRQAQELREARDGKAHLEDSLRSLRYRLDRLQGVDADNDNLRVERSRLEARCGRLAAANRRLRGTAAIIAGHTEDLQAENSRLEQEARTTLVELNTNADLRQRVAALTDQLEADRAALTQAEAENRRLTAALERTQGDLQRFLTRISGTHLESLLSQGDAQTGLLVQIRPGRVLTLGGAALINLRVDPVEGGFQVGLALRSGGDDRAVGEVGIVFYDAEDRTLRRLSYSFPSTEDPNRLVTAETRVSCARFPTSARITVAHGPERPTVVR